MEDSFFVSVREISLAVCYEHLINKSSSLDVMTFVLRLNIFIQFFAISFFFSPALLLNRCIRRLNQDGCFYIPIWILLDLLFSFEFVHQHVVSFISGSCPQFFGFLGLYSSCLVFIGCLLENVVVLIFVQSFNRHQFSTIRIPNLTWPQCINVIWVLLLILYSLNQKLLLLV